MEALSWCALPIRRVALIAFPWRNDAGAANARRWPLHVLLCAAVLAGLWYANGVAGMELVLRSAWPGLHHYWLPLLGVLLYAVAWLGAGLWQALGSVPETAAWPDIDDAWRDARQAMHQAGIDPVSTPLFLILGPAPRGMEDALASLGATKLPLRSTSPVRIFADKEAVYIVCEQLARLGQLDAANGTLEWTDRLRHLGELLRRERAPLFPVQGIVVIVPKDAPAPRVLQACQDDLCDLRAATGLEAPLYLAFGESVPAPSAAAGPHWRLRLPPLPDLDAAEVLAMYQEGIDHLCLAQLPLQAYPYMRPEPEALSNNLGIYQWLSDLHARRGGLQKLLAEGMLGDTSEPGLVAGCYFLPANLAAPQATPLVRTLCADFQAHLGTAAWTPGTLARVDAERRRARWGYVLGALGVALAMGLITGALIWRL